MKNIVLRAALLVLLTLLPTMAWAQPRLDTRSVPSPPKSFVQTRFDATGLVFGTPGREQVWDFRSLPPGQLQNRRYLSPSEFPPSVRDSFPSAQFGIQVDTVLSVYAVQGRYLRLLGTVGSNTQLTVGPDPYDTRPTEIVFSGTIIDAHSGAIRVGTATGRRFGQTSTTYDGYGSLQTPVGRYDSVARLSTIGNTFDTLQTGSDIIVVRRSFRSVVYQSIVSDTQLLVFDDITTSITRNGSPVGLPNRTVSGAYHGSNPATSVDSDALFPNVTVAPCPLRGSVCSVAGLPFTPLSVRLFSMAGPEVHDVQWTPDADGRVSISMPYITPGAYILLIGIPDGGNVVRTIVRL